MALAPEPQQSLAFQTCQILNQTPIVQPSFTPSISMPETTIANRSEVFNKPVTYTPPVTPQAQIAQTAQATPTSGASYSYNKRNVDASGIDGVGGGTEGGNEKLQTASKMKNAALLSGIGSEIANMYSAYQYTRDVKATKIQYENQKKLIDANIDNQEALMTANLQENMAQLDAYAAAKNVDLSSAGIQGIKEKGLMDMEKDFANMQTQANLNKAALDLDYAMSYKNATQRQVDQTISSGFNIASSLFMYNL